MSLYAPRAAALCPNPFCAIELELAAQQCPKCDEPLAVGLRDAMVEVDVAHSGESWTEALDKLESALHFARRERYKGLRVIHGSGRGCTDSWEGPGRIRREVLNYLQQALSDSDASLSPQPHNPGAHLITF